MTDPTGPYWEVFFEVYEVLPRQGPGNRACAERALGLCPDLPLKPEILDLGCGTGGQTLHLAELTPGTITALDSHAPSIERLRDVVAERGLADRIRPMVGDMEHVNLSVGSFDVIWSEGALYNLGLEQGLQVCRRLVRPQGYIAFTDAVWRREDPPPEVLQSFAQDYPTMGAVPDVLDTIDRCGLSVVGHFPLPDEAWWEDFYGPMEDRIAELRLVHADEPEALVVLDEIAGEPEMHRRYSAYYGYEFFVARRG